MNACNDPLPSLYHYLLTLGSSLGCRDAYLKNAVERLKNTPLEILKTSTIFNNPGQLNAVHEFLNQSIMVQTPMEPTSMMMTLRKIEDELGRDRSIYKGDRTIDLDISFAQVTSNKGSDKWRNLTFKDDVVEIPHPLATKRDFVLKTAAEIAPEWIDPMSHLSLSSLWQKFSSAQSPKNS